MSQFNVNQFAATAVNVVDALIIVLDTSAQIVWVNGACLRATGYREDELVGRPIWDILIPPDEVAQTNAVFAELRVGSMPSTHVNDWVTREGTRRRIAWSNAVLTGPNDDVEFIVGTGIDITGRHEIELSLRDRENRLAAVVNTVVDGIITIDRQGLVETFNPAAERIFGYEAADVIGRPVTMLMPAPYRDEHDQYLENYQRTGVAKIIGIGREVKGKRRDGSTFPMDLAVSDVRDHRLFVGIVRDLTANKAAEEQLRHADRLASIGSLAAGLGHDMNNVLLPVRGRLDALEAADLPHAARQHARAIRESVAYLQQLTDGLHLLALDPFDADASGLATNIESWWDQVGPLLQRSLPRDVRLASSIPSQLPPVGVAPHRLTQMLLNLLVNAGDAVGRDGRVRFSAETVEDGSMVRLAVSDNGAGMAPDVCARACEAFFSTKDRGRGTGLGLALVHGIVTKAGGSIDLKSAPDEGTTVTLMLPIARDGAGRRSDQRTTPPPAAVVSLEDERIASMIESLLEDEGFRVSHEPNADPAASALWVLAPGDSDVSAVQRFLKTRGHQVIACGPDAHAWIRLGVLVVDDMMDFEGWRDRIGEALRRIHDAAA